MLDGEHGRARRKRWRSWSRSGTIYGAERMVPVTSVQIAGVSYDNLGEAGLHFLPRWPMAAGKARVLTTLNPAGMDIENWQALGISADLPRNQQRVIDAFARMGVVTTCSARPTCSATCRTSASTLPGPRAAPCATPTRCWARAATARADRAPWPRR